MLYFLEWQTKQNLFKYGLNCCLRDEAPRRRNNIKAHFFLMQTGKFNLNFIIDEFEPIKMNICTVSTWEWVLSFLSVAFSQRFASLFSILLKNNWFRRIINLFVCLCFFHLQNFSFMQWLLFVWNPCIPAAKIKDKKKNST